MNNKIVLIAIFFLIFVFVSIDSYAQSANNEQRIIGTWVNDQDNSRVVFNSNGTISGFAWDSSNIIKFAAAGDKIILYTENNDYFLSGNYSISTDGKTLIIISTMGMLGIYNQIAFSFRRN